MEMDAVKKIVTFLIWTEIQAELQRGKYCSFIRQTKYGYNHLSFDQAIMADILSLENSLS